MFQTKEEQLIDDLIEIVHTLLGNQQADAEIGDERWKEAEAISDRVEEITAWLRQPKCEKCDQRDNGVMFHDDLDRYLCCTSWIKLNGAVIQCDSGFATAEGHAGPHYHFTHDESPSGGVVRVTW